MRTKSSAKTARHRVVKEGLRVPEPGQTVDCTRAPLPPQVIPQDDAARKASPMYRGLLGYFPAAVFAVAQHSMASDVKHNPTRPDAERPIWARGKSTDHEDCIVRHMAEMHPDPDLMWSEQHAHERYHRTAIAWRALAQLQEFLERTENRRAGAHSREEGE